jgi:2-oxoacid:acceptor oxidoreductase delta subunit (pyruvate/2-ketoisovalerate family)
MSQLKTWRELPLAGRVSPATAPQPRTGSWRTGVLPDVNRAACIDCLLCWLYCPDSAIVLDGTAFAGFDLEHCKGCELCAEVCPVDAITMIEEPAA